MPLPSRIRGLNHLVMMKRFASIFLMMLLVAVIAQPMSAQTKEDKKKEKAEAKLWKKKMPYTKIFLS